MKKANIFVLIALWAAFVCVMDSTEAAITDIQILPEEPTIGDVIAIITFGMEGYGPVTIDGSDFLIDGTSLELDIYLNVGPYTVMTPWSHTEDIGTLPAGMYDLTVRTFEMPDVTDTYSMAFEVVPEPATVLLLAMGILGIRANKHKR